MSYRSQCLMYVDNGKIVLPALRVKIAQTPLELTTGLSGRSSLRHDEGMLFVFPTPQIVKMQMRDMKIPLDMLFLDERGRIAHIEENAVPGSTNLYGPEFPVLFAVETNAGWIGQNDVKIGALVELC